MKNKEIILCITSSILFLYVKVISVAGTSRSVETVTQKQGHGDTLLQSILLFGY